MKFKVPVVILSFLVTFLGLTQSVIAQATPVPRGGAPFTFGSGTGAAPGVNFLFRNASGRRFADIFIVILLHPNPTLRMVDFEMVGVETEIDGSDFPNQEVHINIKDVNGYIDDGSEFEIVLTLNADVPVPNSLPMWIYGTNDKNQVLGKLIALDSEQKVHEVAPYVTSGDHPILNGTGHPIKALEIEVPNQLVDPNSIYSGPFQRLEIITLSRFRLEMAPGQFILPGQEFGVGFSWSTMGGYGLGSPPQQINFNSEFGDEDNGDDGEEVECRTTFDVFLFIFVAIFFGLIVLLILWIAGVNPQAVRVAALVLLSQLLIVGVVLLIIGISCGIIFT
ncbi:MAG: hypothetical protein NUW37_00660 [Planctomycetes bacterium]|nr:hypothetical protein [Planctomycetota bacterium]